MPTVVIGVASIAADASNRSVSVCVSIRIRLDGKYFVGKRTMQNIHQVALPR